MNKTILIIVLSIGLIAGAIIFLNKPVTDKKPKNKLNNVSPTGTVFPLQIGNTGIAVKLVQAYCGIKVDGIFGPRTQLSVEDEFISAGGIVTKKMFTDFLVDAGQIAPLDSFPLNRTDPNWIRATMYLQIMLGVTKDAVGVFESETAALVENVFGKPYVTYEDYKSLCFTLFNINEADLFL